MVVTSRFLESNKFSGTFEFPKLKNLVVLWDFHLDFISFYFQEYCDNFNYELFISLFLLSLCSDLGENKIPRVPKSLLAYPKLNVL